MRLSNRMLTPSILNADFARLGSEIRSIELFCDMIHLDVMDGCFVPNITFGLPLIKSLKKAIDLPLETHLMIEDPIRLVERFAEAGSDWISFHIEATDEPEKTVESIKKCGKEAGIAINPPTSVERITGLEDDVLRSLKYILVMTVNPGFGGQTLIEESLEKVRILTDRKRESQFDYLIQVDGGVNRKTLKAVAEAGTDMFVVGSAIFSAESPPDEAAWYRNMLNRKRIQDWK